MTKRESDTTSLNEVAKRCEIAAIRRDLADDNGELRDLLEDAAKEIERLEGDLYNANDH